MLPRVLIEGRRIEPQQQHLIEARAVAHDLGGGIHRPGLDRRSVQRNIGGIDRLPLVVALGIDEEIAGLRPLVGAGLLVLGKRGARERQAHAGGESRPQKLPSRLSRAIGWRRSAAKTAIASLEHAAAYSPTKHPPWRIQKLATSTCLCFSRSTCARTTLRWMHRSAHPSTLNLLICHVNCFILHAPRNAPSGTSGDASLQPASLVLHDASHQNRTHCAISRDRGGRRTGDR